MNEKNEFSQGGSIKLLLLFSQTLSAVLKVLKYTSNSIFTGTLLRQKARKKSHIFVSASHLIFIKHTVGLFIAPCIL